MSKTLISQKMIKRTFFPHKFTCEILPDIWAFFIETQRLSNQMKKKKRQIMLQKRNTHQYYYEWWFISISVYLMPGADLVRVSHMHGASITLDYKFSVSILTQKKNVIINWSRTAEESVTFVAFVWWWRLVRRWTTDPFDSHGLYAFSRNKKSEKCVSVADANSFPQWWTRCTQNLCCFVCASNLALHFVVPAVTSHLRDMDRLEVFICFIIPTGAF